MKILNIEGTIDLMSASEKREGERIFHEMCFLTRQGGEVFLRNISVTEKLAGLLETGSSGRFTIRKTLFSTRMEAVDIGVFG